MKYSYPNTFGFFVSILSVFDIGGNIQKNNITPLSRGLEFDRQRLTQDQNKLWADYQKAYNKIEKDFFGEQDEQ